MSDSDDSRKKQEYKLAARFMDVVEKRLRQMEARTMSGHVNVLDDPERQALLKINNAGLLEGVAAGLLSMVVLRRIRAGFARRAMQSSSASRSASRNWTSMSQQRASRSPFQQKTEVRITNDPDLSKATTVAPGLSNGATTRSPQRTSSLFNALSWIIDGTVSFYIAVFVSIRDTDTILRRAADLPLVAGRSRVATELCPDFLVELRTMQRESSAQDNALQRQALEEPQSKLLKGFLRFCHNCQQRVAYENLLRQQQGLGPTEPVSVPPPGVPHNELGEAGMGVFNNGETMFTDEGQVFDTSSDRDDWMEALVTDKDDESDERRN